MSKAPNGKKTFVKLTHGTLGGELTLDVGQIFAYWHSSKFGCTQILASGGAIAPAKESLATIDKLINQDTIPTGGNHGVSKNQQKHK